MSKKKHSFSNDERRSIIESFENSNTVHDIARVMRVNKSSVRTIIRRFSNSGNSTNSRPKLLSPDEEKAVVGWVDEQPELTLKQLKTKINAMFHKDVSLSTIDRMLKKFCYSIKNMTLVPARRNSEDIIELRFQYAQDFAKVMESIDHENKIFFMDEVGYQVSMRTKRGRSVVGTVPYLTVPALRTRNISVCAIMSKSALFHKKLQARAFNSETFGVFINEVFDYCAGNQLTNCVFICDNVRFHKTNDILNLFLAKGHKLMFLPPYSPFLNPIENAFSKWKNYVKRANSQNEDELKEAIHNGFLCVSEKDCNAYYRHMFTFVIKACLRQEIND